MKKNSLETFSYDGEILEAVQSVSLKTDAQTSAQQGQFSSVVNSLNSAGQSIIRTIQDEHQRNRIQQRIKAEMQENGFSKINYQLVNIGSGISGLENRMRQSSENIVAEIRSSGINIADKLEKTNIELASIARNSAQAVQLLNDVNDRLNTIIDIISKPNEIQAIGFIKQARINLSIGQNEEALRFTRKAMDLCSGSIIVNAYHLITLSLFDEKELDEMEIDEKPLTVFYKFVDLVDFLLFDKDESQKAVQEEIYCMVFPTIFALSRTLDNEILDRTQQLFDSIARDVPTINRLLSKPLLDVSTQKKASEMLLVNGLIWTLILNHLIKRNKVYDKLPHYIAIVSRLDLEYLAIKNELLVSANEVLVSSGVLYDLLCKDWNKTTLADYEYDCLEVFLTVQPQKKLKFDSSTLLMITRFVENNPIEISVEFDKTLQDFAVSLLNKVRENYLAPYVQNIDSIIVQEKETQSSLLEKTSQFKQAIQDRSEELETEKQGYLSRKRSVQDLITEKQEVITLLDNKVIKLRREIPIYLAILPAALIGTAIANLTNFDEFGGFNWFILIASAGIIGLPLSANILEGINNLRHDRANEHKQKISAEQNSVSELTQDIAGLVRKIENLPPKIDKLRIDLEKELIDFAQNSIAEPITDVVLKLTSLRDELLSTYYPPNINESRSLADLGSLIGAKTPESIDISEEFLNDFSDLLSQIRNTEMTKATLKERLFNRLTV